MTDTSPAGLPPRGNAATAQAGTPAAAERTGFASLVPALLIAVFAALGGAVAYYLPPATGEMAVVFAPGTTPQAVFHAVLAAGGSYVNSTRLDNVVVVYASQSDFAARIRAEGGLFTLAARGLCGPASPTESASS